MHDPSMSSPATPLTPHGFVLFHEVGQGGSLLLGGQGKEEQPVRLVSLEHQEAGAAGDRFTRDKLNGKPWAWQTKPGRGSAGGRTGRMPRILVGVLLTKAGAGSPSLEAHCQVQTWAF